MSILLGSFGLFRGGALLEAGGVTSNLPKIPVRTGCVTSTLYNLFANVVLATGVVGLTMSLLGIAYYCRQNGIWFGAIVFGLIGIGFLGFVLQEVGSSIKSGITRMKSLQKRLRGQKQALPKHHTDE